MNLLRTVNKKVIEMLKIVAVGMESSRFSKKSQLPLYIAIKKRRFIICILFLFYFE